VKLPVVAVIVDLFSGVELKAVDPVEAKEPVEVTAITHLS